MKALQVIIALGVIVGVFLFLNALAYLLGGLLGGWAWVTNLLILVLGFVMIIATLLTLAERKWSAMIQDRIGPNRATIALPGLRGRALGGLFHIASDSLKMLFKEDVRPKNADPLLFGLAPILAFAPVLALFAVVPTGPVLEVFGHKVGLQVANPDFGMLWVFAIASLAVYGTALAGWASNNKFALLGGVRASSQMISYEVALGLGLIGLMMAFSSVRIPDMVAGQAPHLWGGSLNLGDTGPLDIGIPGWGIFLQPIGFVAFFAASIAESKRAPFDVPEGESEIIGYFVEYSGMKFGMFMISEFAEVVILGAITTALFFGGWHLGFFGDAWLTRNLGPWPIALGAVYGTIFWVKVILLCYLQLAIRWTFPRFRYDQIQTLGWKILLPMGLANVFITGALLLIDPSRRALEIVGFLFIGFVLALVMRSKEPRSHPVAPDRVPADAHGHAPATTLPVATAAAHEHESAATLPGATAAAHH